MMHAYHKPLDLYTYAYLLSSHKNPNICITINAMVLLQLHSTFVYTWFIIKKRYPLLYQIIAYNLPHYPN
jgi:hypothetical protein